MTYPDATALLEFKDGVCSIALEGAWYPNRVDAAFRELQAEIHRAKVRLLQAQVAQPVTGPQTPENVPQMEEVHG